MASMAQEARHLQVHLRQKSLNDKLGRLTRSLNHLGETGGGKWSALL
jgi:hypothetical protein